MGRVRLPLRCTAALLLAAASSLCLLQLGAGQDASTAGSNCQALLQAGVYNTFRTNQVDIDYSSANQAACSDYSGYTWATYQTETSSSLATGMGLQLNVAVKAFRWTGSSSFAGPRYLTTEIQFNDAKAKAAAYRASSCGSSSITSSSSQYVSTLSQFIAPAVYSAYVACLNLYTSDVRVTQTSGMASEFISLDIKFVPVNAASISAAASLAGMSMDPPNAANCSVYSNGVALAPGADPFKFQLTANTVYSVLCSPATNTPALSAGPDGVLYTDIKITIRYGVRSANTTYHALLFNQRAISASVSSNLQSSVAAMQSQLAALQGMYADVQAKNTVLQAVQSQLADLQGMYADIQAKNTDLLAKAADLATRLSVAEGKIDNAPDPAIILSAVADIADVQAKNVDLATRLSVVEDKLSQITKDVPPSS